MNALTRKTLFWTPRVLTIAFTLFLAVFALDVFGEGHSLGATIVALFMHLIPNFTLLAILVVAWKREWIGAVLFLALGILFVLFAVWRGNGMHWSAFVFIAGPLFLMSALFLLNWIYREELRPSTEGCLS